jgi:hypothetical protein
VYQKLGTAKGPSVLGKSLVAFVLPIVLFVVSLAVTDFWLQGRISNPGLRLLAGVLVSLAVSVIGVAVARRILKIPPAGPAQGASTSKRNA